MFFRLLPFTALFILTSCAYMYEGQIQDIYVETPGADNSICYLYVEGLKYKAKPPQTIQISKSRENLMVDCMAPGNRRHQQFIQPDLSDYAYANIANGVIPGTAWDYAASTLYKYPEIITVDFTNTPVKMEEMPAQNRPDVKQPEEYSLEETLPGRPRMNEDRYKQQTEIKVITDTPPPNAEPYMIEKTTTTTKDKGDLKKAINPAGKPSAAANASAKPATAATSAPSPLTPVPSQPQAVPAPPPLPEKQGPAYPGQ
jgi:hypothetical protein